MVTWIRMRATVIRVGLSISPFVIAIAIYVGLGRAHLIDNTIYPPLSRIGSTAVKVVQGGEFVDAIGSTIFEFILSSAIFMGVGVLLGAVLGSASSIFNMTYGPVSTLFAMPKIVLLPVFVMAFGVGIEQKVAFGAMYGVFPLVMAVMVGAQTISETHDRLFRSIGSSWGFRIRYLTIPAMAPFIASGARIGFVYACAGVLLAEMFVSVNGLGLKLMSTANSATLDEFWVYALTSAVVIITGTAVFQIAETKMSRWKIG